MDISRSNRAIFEFVVTGTLPPMCIMIAYVDWGHLFAFRAYKGLENNVSACSCMLMPVDFRCCSIY